jgi:hypothetical protein
MSLKGYSDAQTIYFDESCKIVWNSNRIVEDWQPYLNKKIIIKKQPHILVGLPLAIQLNDDASVSVLYLFRKKLVKSDF